MVYPLDEILLLSLLAVLSGAETFTAIAQFGKDKLASVVRRHWSVESMHWLMDCLFREDECQVRTGYVPTKFIIIKHIAHNLLRRHPAKLFMANKRTQASWNEQ